MVYYCKQCGAKAFSTHARESIERYVGPSQELIKPYVTGLGTWSCPKCHGKVPVRKEKK